MYAKVFYQIFESSIAEDYITRHVFMDLLVLADDEGVIDKTEQAIARITNVPLNIVQRAIKRLSEPDPHSRSLGEDGRRLVLIDQHRDWGWRIVNHAKYRAIRDEEARRIANRSYKREQRARERLKTAPERLADFQAQLVRDVQQGNTNGKIENVPDAMSMLAREIAVTSPRVLAKLEPVMRQRMKEREMGAYEVGTEMRVKWQEYLHHPKRLGKPMSMTTFFTQGLWLNKDSWIVLTVADTVGKPL